MEVSSQVMDWAHNFTSLPGKILSNRNKEVYTKKEEKFLTLIEKKKEYTCWTWKFKDWKSSGGWS